MQTPMCSPGSMRKRVIANQELTHHLPNDGSYCTPDRLNMHPLRYRHGSRSNHSRPLYFNLLGTFYKSNVVYNVAFLPTSYTYFTFMAPNKLSLVPRISHLTPNSVVRHAHGKDSKFMIVHCRAFSPRT